jgi:eukaryotic translation initiation factor 2C
MMQVPSARLPYPSVQYQWNDFRDKARSREIQPQAFTQSGWNIPDDQAFHDPKVLTLRYFLIQTSYGPIKGSDLQDFENQLKEQLSRRCKVDKRNVVPANPGPDTINFGETGALEASLSKAQHSNSNLVILLIPQIDRWIYAEFKNLADRKYGLRSLCLAKPSQFKDKKYMTNICQKINVKFGGNNASVSGVESKLGNNTLVLGADLVHPGPGALEESPSIACIVGSVDNRGSRFLGSARLQSKMKEDREVSLLPFRRLR